MFLNFPGYSAYIKTRALNQNQGGGVAILIRSGIPHSPVSGLDENLELIGLKINFNKIIFDFFSFYSPSSSVIPYELFNNLENNKTKFILVRDLNSKSKSIGCKNQDSSGDVLDQILLDTSFVIHNDLIMACGIFFDISKAFDKGWHKGQTN